MTAAPDRAIFCGAGWEISWTKTALPEYPAVPRESADRPAAGAAESGAAAAAEAGSRGGNAGACAVSKAAGTLPAAKFKTVPGRDRVGSGVRAGNVIAAE